MVVDAGKHFNSTWFGDTRERLNHMWFSSYRVRASERRIPGQNISSRISTSWARSVWNRNSAMGRQKRKKVKDTIVKCVHDNPISFAFMAFGFVVTWIWLAVVTLRT